MTTKYSSAIGALALASFAALSTLAVAQQQSPRPIYEGTFQDKSGIHRVGTVEATGPFRLDTRQFFPQIWNGISQKPIKPSNPGIELPTLPDLGVRSPVGGATGPENNVIKSFFPGMNMSGSMPPDPQVAAGPTHLVQVANVKIGFFEKSSGIKTFEQSLGIDGFFAGVAAGGFVFDPKVFFDQGSDRFFVIALDRTSSQSGLLIAVSDDDDPSGIWRRYRFEVSRTVDSNDYWLDYPGWGYNKDGIVATGNMFPFSNGSVFSQVVTISKAPLLTGGAATATQFDDFDAFTIQPAHSFDDATTSVYGAAMRSNQSMYVYSIADLAGIPTITRALVGVQPFNFGPGQVPTKGGAQVDTIAGRLFTAAYRNSHLYVSYGAGSNGLAVARWTDFNIGTWPVGSAPTEFQSGIVAASGENHHIQPAISVNSANDVSIIFTRTGPNIAADVLIASRKATDPLGQMGAPTVLVSSSGVNAGMFGRWGDYFSVAIDPVDDLTFWGNCEIVNSNGFWGTWIDSWTVSTSGGGGGGGLFYAPISASTWAGDYDSGNEVDLADSDDSYFEVDSVENKAFGQLAGIETEFQITEDSVARIMLNAEAGLGSGSSATAILFIYNWDTDQYDYLRSWRLTSKEDSTVETTIQKSGTSYVSSDKKVRVLVRAHSPYRRRGRAPRPFELDLDEVNLRIIGS